MDEEEFVPRVEEYDLKVLGYKGPYLRFYGESILYQQVFRWVKKEHKLHVFVDIYPTEGQPDRCWYMVRQMDRSKDIEDYMSGWCESVEDAHLACVRYLIELLKKEKNEI